MNKTRFPELNFTKVVGDGWRIVDVSTSRVVGPCYQSREELLADLDRFAGVFGCAGANPPGVTATAFAAIRRTADSGKEWFAVDEMDLLPDECRKKAAAFDAKCPSWAKDNPVVRVVQMTITENEVC